MITVSEWHPYADIDDIFVRDITEDGKMIGWLMIHHDGDHRHWYFRNEYGRKGAKRRSSPIRDTPPPITMRRGQSNAITWQIASDKAHQAVFRIS